MIPAKEQRLSKQIDALHQGDHVVLFYSSGDELLEAALAFIRHGLENGQRGFTYAIRKTGNNCGINSGKSISSGALRTAALFFPTRRVISGRF
jgi:hypothetical protein